MRKPFATIAFVAAAVVCGTFAGPVRAATITVGTTTYEFPMVTNGNCSIVEAITAANDDRAVDACSAGSGADTIMLPAGTITLTSDVDTLGRGLPQVTSDITLVGTSRAGTVLTGSGVGFVTVGEGMMPALTLRRLTIRDFGPTAAGPIHSRGRLLAFDDVLAMNNRGSGAGGLVEANFGGMMTVTNSRFEGNEAASSGVLNTNATLIISDSFFVGNRATGDTGGALGLGGTTTITNTTFEDNRAFGSGGAIFHRYGVFMSRLTISNSTFRNNRSEDSSNAGGAILSDGPNVLMDVTFEGNRAGVGGGAYSHGSGAIGTTPHRWTCTRCTFRDNRVGQYGGGAEVFGPATISDSVFEANRAAQGGGFASSLNGDATITGTVFRFNHTGLSVSLEATDPEAHELGMEPGEIVARIRGAGRASSILAYAGGIVTVRDSCVYPNAPDSVEVFAGSADLAMVWWGDAGGPGVGLADTVVGASVTTSAPLASAPAICATVPTPPTPVPSFNITGTATLFEDYAFGTLVAESSFVVNLPIGPMNDGAMEGDETVIFTVEPSATGDWIVGDPPTATVTIIDDGMVAPDAGPIAEDAGPGADAGPIPDAGPAVDAGPRPDAGPGVDAGLPIGPIAPKDEGGCCTIAAGRDARAARAAPLLALATLALAFTRLCRRRL